MKWPSNSPDLNPIENIWNILKQTVNNKRPSNVKELLQSMKESWEEISSDACQKLVDSMPRRHKQ